jgi:predicted metalloendopeptidase
MPPCAAVVLCQHGRHGIHDGAKGCIQDIISRTCTFGALPVAAPAPQAAAAARQSCCVDRTWYGARASFSTMKQVWRLKHRTNLCFMVPPVLPPPVPAHGRDNIVHRFVSRYRVHPNDQSACPHTP